MPSQQPATRDGSVVETRVSETFKDWLNRRAVEEDVNRSYDVAASQLDRMLIQTDEDAIMESDEFGAHQARDLVGFEFEAFPGFRVVKSSEKFDAPLGVYIQFNASALSAVPERGIAIGDEVLISTGATLIIGKLRTLEANGYLPKKLMIAGIDAANGTVLKLRNPPARAETA